VWVELSRAAFVSRVVVGSGKVRLAKRKEAALLLGGRGHDVVCCCTTATIAAVLLPLLLALHPQSCF
jgi:hypothetical protein